MTEVAVSGAVTGLVANTTYRFRIVATNSGGTKEGSEQTFKRLPLAPTTLTDAASSPTQTLATVDATVNPNGGEVTACTFEYGTSEAYGSSAPCSSLPGSGSSPVAVSATLAGLSANTTYHFRISATSAGGTSKGSDATVKTLPNAPAVSTQAATPITQTSATLNATVNPDGGEVTGCVFEYGTTPSYGSSVSCSSLPGSGAESSCGLYDAGWPQREHDLLLQDRCDQLGWHQRRQRTDLQNAAQSPHGPNRSRFGPCSKRRDAQCSDKPEWRGNWCM